MASKKTGKLAFAIGGIGVLAGVLISAVTPALGVPSSSAPIVSAHAAGPITLTNSNKTLVKLTVPAGKWVVSGKMWADSVASQPSTSTVVGCSMFQGSKFLDNSAFNTPKVGGAGGSSAGVNVLTAVITTKSKTTVTLKCDDFGSQAVAHSIVLTAIG